MAGIEGLDEDFVEVESNETIHVNVNVNHADAAKHPPRWRQIEMLREKRELSHVLSEYDDYEFDDSEEE
jgi:hypothetical protein